jgi:UDP-glucuronate decarboxylase
MMEAVSRLSKVKIDNKRPTALVAGGAGFIGSYLSEVLLTQNFNVIAVDDLANPNSKDNIRNLHTYANFSF